MLFNSVTYLLFFVIVMIGAKALPHRGLQQSFLLVASIYFYASWNAWLVLLILGSAVIDYLLALRIARTETQWKRRAFLIVSLVSNLGLLASFKYANFALGSIYALQQWLGLTLFSAPPSVDIVLPVGISFYTFQTLSYTVDVYRKKLDAERSFRTFLLFVTFFPQLVAGPIVRAVDFLPQLRSLAVVVPANVKIGFTWFLCGLIKKVVFADSLGGFVEKIYGDPVHYSSVPIVLATIAYAIQIYCDFSGYTDMAIGSAAALGFILPQNFAFPYLARNVAEFWQRWHISLSTWLRDYLYIPLGGSRGPTAATCRNLMVTMLLGGLWHGAKWTFVLWGAYQGILLVGHRLLSRAWSARKVRNTAASQLPGKFHSSLSKLLATSVTLYFVLVGWILFRAQSFGDAQYLLRKFICFDGFHRSNGIYLREALTVGLLIAAFMACHLFSYSGNGLAGAIAARSGWRWTACVGAGVLLVMLMAPARSPEFIYFQF